MSEFSPKYCSEGSSNPSPTEGSHDPSSNVPNNSHQNYQQL